MASPTYDELPDISYYYASKKWAGMVDPVLISARNTPSQSFRITIALISMAVLMLLGGWFQYRRLGSPD